MKGGELDLDHTLLLCASAVVTASIASFLLGLVMVAVIILCRRCHINPDNVNMFFTNSEFTICNCFFKKNSRKKLIFTFYVLIPNPIPT